MPVKDLFSEQSSLYKIYRPEYPADLYKFIMSHVPDTCLAWDVGTGNGQVAKALSMYFTSVYASDISEKQLAEAHKEENICYVKCPAESCGLPDKSVDLITVAQAVHWFDFEKFYHEVRRVAREHAIIAAWGYGLLSVNNEIDELILDFYQVRLGKYWSAERKLIDHAYSTIPFPFKEINTPEFFIETLWTIQQLEGYLNTWSAVNSYRQQEKTNPVDDLIHHIEKHWHSGENRKISFPIFLRMGEI